MSRQKRSLKIALDFDEVIVQAHAFLSEICFQKHGMHLPAHVYRYPDWDSPPITEEEYRNVIFHHRTPPLEWAESIALVPGALEGIALLLDSGLDISILTARGLYAGEIEAVEHVLKRHQLSLPIVGTAYQAKAGFLDDHTLIMDDQIHELQPISEEVHRLLFCRPHNIPVWQNPQRGIVPVNDWPHAVEKIKELLNL